MQRLAALVLVVSTALVACAAPTLDAPETASVESVQTAPVATPEAEPAPLPCGTVFTPDPEVLEETRAAAARWSTATGCDIRVGEGGTRVRLVASIDDNGTARPGLTHYEDDGVALVIDVIAARSGAVLVHEMGHVLNPHPGHIAGETALMSHAGGLGRITGADLEYVCDGYGCTAFVPEA